jgi:hypothetical protein
VGTDDSRVVTMYQLVLFGFYPLWLLAGGVDYLCHRRSQIERTSGVRESWLHVGELACMLLIVGGLALFFARGLVLAMLVLLVVAHTLLSYIDVRYTQPRRTISPLEQHVHALMDVLPLAAVAVIAVLDAGAIEGVRRQPGLTSTQLITLLGSLLALGGLPLFEELLRTRRAARHAGFTTMR